MQKADQGKVNVDARDNDGWTPLSRAAENGNEAVARLLLAIGKVDVDARGNDGRTPLLWAARNGNKAIVQPLVTLITSDRLPRLSSMQTPCHIAILLNNVVTDRRS